MEATQEFVSPATLPPPLPLNGDQAYFWQGEPGKSLLWRGLVVEVVDSMVKVFAGADFDLPLAEVYPTYIDAVERGAERGHFLPPRKEKPKALPRSVEVWVCSGCKATEKPGPLDVRMRLNPAITLRLQKCRKCKDEMLLVTRMEVSDEGVAAVGGAVRQEAGGGASGD